MHRLTHPPESSRRLRAEGAYVVAFAGGERGSRLSQARLNIHRERVRATEPAPRGPFRLCEHLRSVAEIVERGAGVLVQRPRVIPDDLAPRGCALVVSL